MKLIEPDEKSQFHAILSAQHLAADDFELHEVDTTDPKTDEIFALSGFVTVSRKSTSRQQQYPIGDGSIWVAEFERDLSQGVFD
ncbi:transcriptional regulator [Collimonas silvisoli]|uniref:transcriptional regulator n=1 Tax=Collimonas silvisoli TaxID=2825884 RepID=UPI001B8CFE91|nr:transcriptional regulator [Collimonas silvisoli]